MINKEELNHIRNSVDIIDIVGSYIPLTNRGKNYFGVCPFHDDHSPSMSVSKDKQIYTCFSCGATGNVYNFIMDYENITFIEAVKIVALKAGININIGLVKEKSNNSSVLYDIYETSFKFYQNNLQTNYGIEAKEYLNNRCISDEIIKHFGIGLSLKNRNILSKLLQKKGISDDNLIKSGLVNINEHGTVDMYYDRIMFPLHDLFGKVVGFSGRIYHGEDSSKYINTKETEIFKKGEILYNYHLAKNECRSNGTVIVVEGFLDVIRMYEIGIKNVVATMGTAVTKEQASHLKKLAKDIILCFDGDKAGVKATILCIKELENINVIPKIVQLEENLDPDEFIIKYGKDRFLGKINNPSNIMDYRLSVYKNDRDFSNPNDTNEYIKKILFDLSKIDDDLLREITLKKISEETKLDFDFLKNQFKKNNKSNKVEITKKAIKQYTKYQKAEINLIYYMLRDKNVIKTYNKKITHMPSDNYRKLAREVSLFYKNNGFIDVADFMTFIQGNDILMKSLSTILCLNLCDEYSNEEIDDYIKTIRDYNIEHDIRLLDEKIKLEVDPIIKAEYLQKIIDLKLRGEYSNERD